MLERYQYEGIADGTIDVVIQTSGGTAGLFPFVQVLDLPYLMADDRVAESVLANGSQFVTTMQDMVAEKSGGAIRLMTIGNTGGWRNFANTQRRIANPGDMEGLKIMGSWPTCRRSWSSAWRVSDTVRGLSCSPASRLVLSRGSRTASPTS